MLLLSSYRVLLHAAGTNTNIPCVPEFLNGPMISGVLKNTVRRIDLFVGEASAERAEITGDGGKFFERIELFRLSDLNDRDTSFGIQCDVNFKSADF